jgi:hypothetical protein
MGVEASPESPRLENDMKIQAAAISLQGTNFAVVLAGIDLLNNSGEADMTIDRLQPTFGGVPVVLMAQSEDGSPRYYGDAGIVRLLEGVPVEQMPWQEYQVK